MKNAVSNHAVNHLVVREMPSERFVTVLELPPVAVDEEYRIAALPRKKLSTQHFRLEHQNAYQIFELQQWRPSSAGSSIWSIGQSDRNRTELRISSSPAGQVADVGFGFDIQNTGPIAPSRDPLAVDVTWGSGRRRTANQPATATFISHGSTGKIHPSSTLLGTDEKKIFFQSTVSDREVKFTFNPEQCSGIQIKMKRLSLHHIESCRDDEFLDSGLIDLDHSLSDKGELTLKLQGDALSFLDRLVLLAEPSASAPTGEAGHKKLEASQPNFGPSPEKPKPKVNSTPDPTQPQPAPPSIRFVLTHDAKSMEFPQRVVFANYFETLEVDCYTAAILLAEKRAQGQAEIWSEMINGPARLACDAAMRAHGNRLYVPDYLENADRVQLGGQRTTADLNNVKALLEQAVLDYYHGNDNNQQAEKFRAWIMELKQQNVPPDLLRALFLDRNLAKTAFEYDLHANAPTIDAFLNDVRAFNALNSREDVIFWDSLAMACKVPDRPKFGTSVADWIRWFEGLNADFLASKVTDDWVDRLIGTNCAAILTRTVGPTDHSPQNTPSGNGQKAQSFFRLAGWLLEGKLESGSAFEASGPRIVILNFLGDLLDGSLMPFAEPLSRLSDAERKNVVVSEWPDRFEDSVANMLNSTEDHSKGPRFRPPHNDVLPLLWKCPVLMARISADAKNILELFKND